MDPNLPLQSDQKAVLFTYRLYLLPSGDLQSSISNVEPEVLKRVVSETLPIEEQNLLASAVQFLIAEMGDVETRLDKHLSAL